MFYHFSGSTIIPKHCLSTRLEWQEVYNKFHASKLPQNNSKRKDVLKDITNIFNNHTVEDGIKENRK